MSMLVEDEEYAAALASELEELQANLATLRQERDQGKKTVRQLRTEQIFLKKQKEQREKYRALSLQKELLQIQFEETKQQKKNALQQLVREKSGVMALDRAQQDISEITFGIDDTGVDVNELNKEFEWRKGNEEANLY